MLAAGNRTATTVTAATAAGYATDPALPFFLERYAEAYRAEMASFIDALRKRIGGLAQRRGRPQGADPGRRRDRERADRAPVALAAV